MEKNEGQQNRFFIGSFCFTKLGKSAVLLLSDLVITEFRAHTLNIMTVSPDNTFISKFSTLWNFTMRKCHRNKTFHSFFQKVTATHEQDKLPVYFDTSHSPEACLQDSFVDADFFFKVYSDFGFFFFKATFIYSLVVLESKNPNKLHWAEINVLASLQSVQWLQKEKSHFHAFPASRVAFLVFLGTYLFLYLKN